jgi:hypothetical protein
MQFHLVAGGFDPGIAQEQLQLGNRHIVFSSAIKVNSQYMHLIQFNIRVKNPTTVGGPAPEADGELVCA